jgi:hypothetical protein
MERIIAVVNIDAADITYRLSDNTLLAVPHGGHVYHIGDTVGFPGSGLGRVQSGAGIASTGTLPAAPAEPESEAGSQSLKSRARKKAPPRDATAKEQAAADAVADKKEAEAE